MGGLRSSDRRIEFLAMLGARPGEECLMVAGWTTTLWDTITPTDPALIYTLHRQARLNQSRDDRTIGHTPVDVRALLYSVD
ncbi:hypothetical protein ElyMa_006479300 [Elysia marginata]|uniref:Uncharacterized protein n=1 Tax=Elysia marginata TaxID=1093978 RepID=A0AAV4HZY9_9GAST|nr:hypothetical protein ElyMa_006479300 [Elysia marginata]